MQIKDENFFLLYLNTQKKILDFSSVPEGNDIVKADIPNLIEFLYKYAEEIEHINLRGHPIGDEGAKKLLSATNIHVKHIDLSNTGITSNATEKPHANTKIERLTLNDNNIGDQGIISLIAHPSIKYLCARHCGITATGAKALSSNPKLEHIDMVVSTDEAEAVKEALEEVNPTKRYNAARSTGAEAGIPSLQKLSLFAVRTSQDLPKFLSEVTQEFNASLMPNVVVNPTF